MYVPTGIDNWRFGVCRRCDLLRSMVKTPKRSDLDSGTDAYLKFRRRMERIDVR
jgi:hypothetical protein